MAVSMTPLPRRPRRLKSSTMPGKPEKSEKSEKPEKQQAQKKALGNATSLVRKFLRKSVASHPYFVRLAAEPLDLGAVWLLMANLREGISRHFIQWLATTIERVHDRRIGSLLAVQLNDELGRGDFSQIHSLLLDRFVTGLSRWRVEGSNDELLRAGQRLAQEAARPFAAADPYEGVGALVAGEIFAEKMDTALAHEMERQDLLSDDVLTWLHLHAQLEVDHAEDSGELALLIPKDEVSLAAAWRGAENFWKTLWQFLDEVHAVQMSLQRPGERRRSTVGRVAADPTARAGRETRRRAPGRDQKRSGGISPSRAARS